MITMTAAPRPHAAPAPRQAAPSRRRTPRRVVSAAAVLSAAFILIWLTLGDHAAAAYAAGALSAIAAAAGMDL